MKHLLITAMMLNSFSIIAQHNTSLNQYIISHVLINPGATGFDGNHQLQVHARGSWYGFPGAPKTGGFQYNGALSESFGLGAGVFSESAANLDQLRARLNFAFKFNVSKNTAFSAGISTEFHQTKLNSRILDNNFFEPGDILADRLLNGRSFLDATLGFYGRFHEKTFVGLAFSNLVMASLDDIESGLNEDMSLRYYALHAGHKFDFPYRRVSLEPSILVRQIRGSPFQIDMNFKAGFIDDKLITGFSYRSLGTTGMLLGTRWSFFELYYTYDLSLQRFQNYNAGSHEFTLGLTFGKD